MTARRSLTAFGVGLAVAFLGSAAPGMADPTGISVARVELNRDADSLEVALRVEPKPLSRALTSYFGEPIDLSRSEPRDPEALAQLERRLARYVRDTFSVSLDDETDLDHRWVGWERESFRRIWLYFELVPPEPESEGAPTLSVAEAFDERGLRVSHRLFFELKAQQANTVRLRDGDRQKAVVCSRDEPEHWIRRDPKPAPANRSNEK